MAKYDQTSPYYLTPIVNGTFLDFMTNRPIPAAPTDQYWTITPTYNLRPDLLAYDLYNDSRLWWVFAQRNPNKITDPLGDFVIGLSIYLPTIDTLKSALGV
jgi:hypothetical protein